jgi:hypothetical protein
MASNNPATLKRRAANSAKQQRYLAKVRGADALEKRAQELREEIRTRVAGKEIDSSRLDLMLMERGKPLREQPPPCLDTVKRTRFVHVARTKHKRALYDWLQIETKRLETALDHIKDAPLIKTVHYAQDDLVDMLTFFPVEEEESVEQMQRDI